MCVCVCVCVWCPHYRISENSLTSSHLKVFQFIEVPTLFKIMHDVINSN